MSASGALAVRRSSSEDRAYAGLIACSGRSEPRVKYSDRISENPAATFPSYATGVSQHRLGGHTPHHDKLGRFDSTRLLMPFSYVFDSDPSFRDYFLLNVHFVFWSFWAIRSCIDM
jgi:hypothetical protein